MADPKNLVEFATQWRDEQKARVTQTAGALSTAQAQDTAAQTALTAARASLLAANTKLVDIRTQLGKIPMPADGEPLLVALRTAIADQRTKAAAMTQAELTAAQAMASRNAVQARVERIAKALALAESDLQAAIATRTKRQAALDALAVAPLADVKQAATDALAGADYAAAKQRIKDTVPAALLKRATERWALAAGLIDRQGAEADAVLASADAETELTTLAGDKLARLKRAVDVAERNLLAYTNRAVADLAAAMSNVAYLTDPATNKLTAQQVAHLTDAALATDRANAAKAEGERDVAAVAVADAFSKLQIERAKALAADPAADLTTLEADATSDLGKAKAAWELAKTELTKPGGKEALFTQAMRDTLAEWQASVPDALWADLARWLDADATLTRLKGATTTLTNGLKNAEKDLLQAQIDDAKRRRRQAWLADGVAARQATAAESSKRMVDLQAHALRGNLVL
ncbi:hypothetical protein [Chitinivorax sp. B]|uniref:hypothetical protein n=1 Tax=Chitinivorax sp. B TaxID=2502235 RepID=UPI0010F987EF|nr:hypothetical protein [Chitinivorax sp. B]